jgi:hypothetical protein
MLLTTFIAASDPLYVMAGALLVVVLVALGVRFRRTLFTLGPRTVLTLCAAHLGRYVLLLFVLQVLQWWVVVPDAPLRLWAAMLIVATVVSRAPFIPARDLAGIGAIFGVVTLPAAHEAAIAAMLLTRTVLDKMCNLGLAIANSALDRRKEKA